MPEISSALRSPSSVPWGLVGARPGWGIGSRPAACKTPRLVNRVRVRSYGDEEGGTILWFQPLLDECAEDDLEAHGKLDRRRRLPGHDPSPGQDILREDQQDSRGVFHPGHLRFVPAVRPVLLCASSKRPES